MATCMRLVVALVACASCALAQPPHSSSQDRGFPSILQSQPQAKQQRPQVAPVSRRKPVGTERDMDLDYDSPYYKQTSMIPDIVPTTPRNSVHKKYPHAVLFGGTCGGTIIAPTWILSAAHCSLFSAMHDVLAGTSNSDDGSGVRVRVKRVVIHPQFTVGPYWLNAKRFNITQVAAHYDFLLAELEEPLPFDYVNIAAVQLDNDRPTPVGQHVGFGGYGASEYRGYMRHVMHGTDMEILSDKECGELEQYDSRDMICARGSAPRFDTACNGDSGSGLVGDGRLIGVTSWVENDAFECRNGLRVVFGRVAIVTNWIKQVANV